MGCGRRMLTLGIAPKSVDVAHCGDQLPFDGKFRHFDLEIAQFVRLRTRNDSPQEHSGLVHFWKVSMSTLRSMTAAMAILAGASWVHAATDSASFNVKLIITATCDIHAVPPTDVDFLTHDSTATNLTATGQLTAKCTPGTTYNIGLDDGQHSTGTLARRMQSTTTSTNYVAYDLYKDAARSQQWGASIGTNTLGGTGTGSAVAVQIYGGVPSANSPAGTYNDIVNATITY